MTLPLNGRSHDVLTHIGIPDRPFLGRTTKELCLIVGGLVGGLGAAAQPGVLPPVGVAEGLAIAAVCLAVAVVRPLDRSLLAWGRVAFAFATQPRLRAWRPSAPPASPLPESAGGAPPHLAAFGALPVSATPRTPDPRRPGWRGRRGAGIPGIPGAPGPLARPAAVPRTQDEPYVPIAIENGVVAFADGSRCATIECSGRNTSLLDPAGRQALHVGFHAFLMGLPCPIKFLTISTPADLRASTALRVARLAGLPPGLRRLESADTAYMNRIARRTHMLDHHTYAIVPLADAPTPAPPRPLPALPTLQGPLARLRPPRARVAATWPLTERDLHLLDERCERIIADLVPAGVNAWRLRDTAALLRLWYGLLHPRGALLQPLPALPATPLAPPTISFAWPHDAADAAADAALREVPA